ncbi:FAD binding domain-containing protein [Copromyces sp. CBS 386.78]|nr:FAD binding domain-containing protein [Copromyces sp. CBS 386.78]
MSQQEEKVDVLICGSGSAGLCAAVWLARFGINYKILERRDGPLHVGQADGVQTRTVEIFDSFGIGEELLREAYHVLETAFWEQNVAGGNKDNIKRTSYAPDKETAISHQPHLILNQARLNALMIGLLGDQPPIQYNTEVKTVHVDESADITDLDSYPVRVEAVTADGVSTTYRAKYALGCDGAHSVVRKSLGFKMVGDSTDAVWGVMDVFPLTNFPDIRKKAAINSSLGNLLLIPREGDAMVRFYIELPPGTEAKHVTLEDLQKQAKLIFRPYDMEIADTFWWSAYAIGQRRADYFHKNHRVFLTGDACHTHSPKAGQGMNVSLQDGHNIGWKLGLILNGLGKPKSLLESYVIEREKTATDLIEFDRGFTKLFNTKYRREHGISQEQFAEKFVQAGRYTAGQAIQYDASGVVEIGAKDKELVMNVTVGMRFPSAQVVRFCDARAMQLVNGLPADGQWYLIVFAGDISQKEGKARLEKVSQALDNVVKRFTPASASPDSVIDRVLVIYGNRTEVEQEQIPEFFTPVTGKWHQKNLFKVYADDESYNSGHGHAYETYGVDFEAGALVIVRPDHYVAKVSALDDNIEQSTQKFFDGFLVSTV